MNMRMDKRIDIDKYAQFVGVRIYERYERNIHLQIGDALYNNTAVKLTTADAQKLIDILESAISMIHYEEQGGWALNG